MTRELIINSEISDNNATSQQLKRCVTMSSFKRSGELSTDTVIGGQCDHEADDIEAGSKSNTVFD